MTPSASRTARAIRRPPGTTMPAQVDPTTCGIAALCAVGARAGLVPQLRGYLDADPGTVRATQLRAHRLAAGDTYRWPLSLGTFPLTQIGRAHV